MMKGGYINRRPRGDYCFCLTSCNLHLQLICVSILLFVAVFACAENVDPNETGSQYGYSENAGWLNAEPDTGDGMQVASNKVTGWVWGENIGWINLHCENNDTCAAVSFGVINDGDGNLSGYAWAENVGWINFDPNVPGDTINQYKVTIDIDGKLSGWAWGENIGWIHFDKTQSWDVWACIVTLEDLSNFASYWLQSGALPSNLDETGNVDMADFSIFASWWKDYCPAGWTLK